MQELITSYVSSFSSQSPQHANILVFWPPPNITNMLFITEKRYINIGESSIWLELVKLLLTEPVFWRLTVSSSLVSSPNIFIMCKERKNEIQHSLLLNLVSLGGKIS